MWQINYLLNSQYSVKKNITFKPPILGSDMCDYSDTFIVVKGRTNVAGTKIAKKKKNPNLKINYSFRSCISKTNVRVIDYAEDCGIVMPIYN